VPNDGNILLIYDGDCGFCSASAAWIQAKWRPGGAAKTVPWQRLREAGLERLGLTARDTGRAAWWVEDGQKSDGHLAVGHAWRLLVAPGALSARHCWSRRCAGLPQRATQLWHATGTACLVERPPARPEHGGPPTTKKTPATGRPRVAQSRKGGSVPTRTYRRTEHRTASGHWSIQYDGYGTCKRTVRPPPLAA
jgi:predicted DCC family thiol-disulfide oxidoreductase YuxK